jgi:hypothetical protein
VKWVRNKEKIPGMLRSFKKIGNYSEKKIRNNVEKPAEILRLALASWPFS